MTVSQPSLDWQHSALPRLPPAAMRSHMSVRELRENAKR